VGVVVDVVVVVVADAIVEVIDVLVGSVEELKMDVVGDELQAKQETA
jgi:hypothetical protein